MIRARKRFGQHFLHDPACPAAHRRRGRIPCPASACVEIGPGPGALTARLLAAAGALDAIEIDRDLAAALRTRWPRQLTPARSRCAGIRLRRPGARRAADPLRVVGNLPYNISTPLLFQLLEQVDHIVDLHVMLQKEVIDRMAAAPGSEDYGRLTVMLAPRLHIAEAVRRRPRRIPPAAARLVGGGAPAGAAAAPLCRATGLCRHRQPRPSHSGARPCATASGGCFPTTPSPPRESIPGCDRKCWRRNSSPRWPSLRVTGNV